MHTDRTTLLATLIVIGTGILWGFYWIPVRRLTDMGLAGAWSSLAIVAAAALLLAPFAIRERRQLTDADPLALASITLGGVAFVLYSVAFVYGRVAIVILMFFLTPVWSTLIGRYLMGWHTPRLRTAAIVLGLAGLAVMLGANGDLPIPRGLGEWLALISGLLWSVATTGIRTKSELTAGPAAFIFAIGACTGALILAPLLAPWPDRIAEVNPVLIIGWAVAAGGLWWSLSTASLMWATARLEPARVGILLMTEVLVGALSAALLAGEHLGTLEIIGGAMVLCAGVLEVWPLHRGTRGSPT